MSDGEVRTQAPRDDAEERPSLLQRTTPPRTWEVNGEGEEEGGGSERGGRGGGRWGVDGEGEEEGGGRMRDGRTGVETKVHCGDVE